MFGISFLLIIKQVLYENRYIYNSKKMNNFMDQLDELDVILNEVANPETAKIHQGFFKTGEGQYGAGDVFLGIVVPEQRKIAKQFMDLGFDELQKLLNSEVHEKRLVSLLILVERYKGAGDEERQEILDFYLDNAKNINNWDLVDLSAPNIVGNYLLSVDNRDLIYDLAKSKNLWEKRIAIVSTFALIRDNQLEDTLRISEILLNDSHDLIYKAVGWMLRELGKRDRELLEDFLKKHYGQMPRTMLRYAIEKFEEGLRQDYLKGRV